MHWPASPPPRILSEHLRPVSEPLALLLRPGVEAAPAAVAARAARALLDLPPLAPSSWPAWLAPHQIAAAERLTGMLQRYGGALLADAVGLGKSFVALAVAHAGGVPFALVIPAVLVRQWRDLLVRLGLSAPIVTHEQLSGTAPVRWAAGPAIGLFVVDEAHRFRNPATRRYHALARLLPGARALLVTATPVHNRLADLYALFRLFVRDHGLAALGIPSLSRAMRGEVAPPVLAAVAARLTVARSRQRVRGYASTRFPLRFPRRAPPETIRAGVAPDPLIAAMTDAVQRLRNRGPAAALLRATLLRRLASSIPAFASSLNRFEAFLDLAGLAAADGRVLTPRDFQRLFPREHHDLQLALFPLLLEPGSAAPPPDADRTAIARLRALGIDHPLPDPKAAALERLLHERDGKTIVFTDAEPTVHYLRRRLRHRRVATLTGAAGSFAGHRASRDEVLAAFAPVARRGAAPPAALATEVLLATDLASEGLNLQDAVRVIHYDLPWSPARLAQRVGRIDRLGSPHATVQTVSFLPPEALAGAIDLEGRLAIKTRLQRAAGTPQLEHPDGRPEDGSTLDWCDRLQSLAVGTPAFDPGSCAAVEGTTPGVVLIVRVGGLCEAVVIEGTDVRADPDRATELLEQASRAAARLLDRPGLEAAIVRAAPLLRQRLAAVAAARWHAADRDRLSRRLIPWVLAAGRRAARAGDRRQLAALDDLVSRLTLGMTAGEELRLADLMERRAHVSVRDLLAWHNRLAPVSAEATPENDLELVAAVVICLTASGGADPNPLS